jgi:hypothetical protein
MSVAINECHLDTILRHLITASGPCKSAVMTRPSCLELLTSTTRIHLYTADVQTYQTSKHATSLQQTTLDKRISNWTWSAAATTALWWHSNSHTSEQTKLASELGKPFHNYNNKHNEAFWEPSKTPSAGRARGTQPNRTISHCERSDRGVADMSMDKEITNKTHLDHWRYRKCLLFFLCNSLHVRTVFVLMG